MIPSVYKLVHQDLISDFHLGCNAQQRGSLENWRISFQSGIHHTHTHTHTHRHTQTHTQTHSPPSPVPFTGLVNVKEVTGSIWHQIKSIPPGKKNLYKPETRE